MQGMHDDVVGAEQETLETMLWVQSKKPSRICCGCRARNPRDYVVGAEQETLETMLWV